MSHHQNGARHQLQAALWLSHPTHTQKCPREFVWRTESAMAAATSRILRIRFFVPPHRVMEQAMTRRPKSLPEVNCRFIQGIVVENDNPSIQMLSESR